MNPDEMITEVLKRTMAEAPQGWCELIVRYLVDSHQSSQIVTCLVDRDGHLVEEPLAHDPGLDAKMRELRAVLAQAGGDHFSEAKLHLQADGEFKVSFGYEPVDWEKQLLPSWNFADRTQVRV